MQKDLGVLSKDTQASLSGMFTPKTQFRMNTELPCFQDLSIAFFAPKK